MTSPSLSSGILFEYPEHLVVLWPKPSPVNVLTGRGGKPACDSDPEPSASRPVQGRPSGPNSRVVSRYESHTLGPEGLATVAVSLGVNVTVHLCTRLMKFSVPSVFLA